MRSRLLLPLLLTLLVAGCRMEAEERDSLPEADVEGSLTTVDGEPADIGVTTDTQVVRIPEMEIDRAPP